jgi:hypothetical protein
MTNLKNIMKHIPFACLALLIPTMLLARDEPFRTDINPALLYYRAFQLAPQPMSEADDTYLSSKEGMSQKLPERFGPIVAGYNNEFKLIRQAAQQKVPCDWGLDMSPGPATLMPHLAPAKKAAQAAQLRVRWDLENGREAEARDDLLAALVLGRNLSHAKDSVVISVLVSIAIENMVDGSMVAPNFGRFSPETLRQLVEGFDAAPAMGTMADATGAEVSMHQQWLIAAVQRVREQHPGNDAAVVAELANYWPVLTNAAGASSEGILKMEQDSEPMLARFPAIMALPHGEYEKQIEQFIAEVQKSGDFILASEVPALQKARQKEFACQVVQAMTRAAVAYKLSGQEGLQSVRDPFGNGPFAIQRYVFEGVDCGFALKSAYTGLGNASAFAVVEKAGTPCPSGFGKQVLEALGQ